MKTRLNTLVRWKKGMCLLQTVVIFLIIFAKDCLMKHKRVQFNIMLIKGILWTHLAEIDEQASAMFSRLAEQMKVNAGITEQFKSDDQMEWVARMNNIEERAREIVNHELIFTA